jgi:hypothetical protein
MYAKEQDRAAYQRNYYLRNKEKLRKYARKYYLKNKDKMIVQMKGWRKRRVDELLNYVRGLKERTPCADCGGVFHHIAMDFDHLPGKKKLFSISTLVMKTVSLERIQREIEKCEIVCANCHRVRTFNRRSSLRALKVSHG